MGITPCWFRILAWASVMIWAFTTTGFPGATFSPSRCEQLLGLNGKLREEGMLAGKPIPELQERLAGLQQALIERTLLVEKQPPQVIKTQSKFSTTVRYLLGEKVAPGKPVVVKAQIITEAQARILNQHGVIPM
ncbi:hypothetical protein CRUP_034029 [Coryphaenoides rupestris]|nr:hypothetical protein CRUP_034029 [Coryphaenoides rupestris]